MPTPGGEERPYLVMEYFPGEPLDGWLARHGPLPPEELPALARPLAEGMRAAHAAGVLHRDLKPENLLARREGGWQVKIIDFGLALRQSADPSAQEPALAAGTLHFAPPEQLGRRPEPVGTYSDVYAFGKTLAYCLFLRTELLRRDWRTLEEALPGLAEWIERCLEEEPARRFQDFDAVLGGLAELDESQRTAAIPPPPAPAPRPSIPAPVAPVVPAVQANPAAMTYRQYKER
jgi:serine/threonine protein kinase